MDGRDGELTLEGLAQRLETLERENTELRKEVVALRGPETRSNGSAETRSLVQRRDGERASQFDEVVSRRALLGKAGAAAVAAMAAGTLLYPREAKAETTFFDKVSAHEVLADTRGIIGFGVIGVKGMSGTLGQAGVYGQHETTRDGPGVVGDGVGPAYAGVLGRNSNGTGVWGQSAKTGYSGVYGEHTGTSGYGIVGDGKGTGAGVLGRNPGGTGVQGEGSTTAEVAGVRGKGTTGVWGSSSRTGYSGLYGQHTGSAGFGAVGDGTGASGAGILGRNPSGYGGQFEGGKAQLMLKPGGRTGKPPILTQHIKGEIYMDSAGTLYVCVANSSDDAPAKWRKVTTTAV